MQTAEYIYQEVLQNAHCLIVSLDGGNLVTDLNFPWGDWSVGSIEIGAQLPEPLLAVLAATPLEQKTKFYPYIYLDEELVVDVHVCSNGAHRQLILRDVSDIHQAELKFQQKAHEVSLLLETQAALNRQLELQRAEVERASQAKSRFIASMSHEFRTPITSIMGLAEILSRQKGEAGLPAAIQRASWHLLALVENLLEQARQGEGIVQLNPGPVDLGRVLKDMRDLFATQAGAKGLELIIMAPDGEVQLELDELRLRQVLINLLGNAIRYTEKGQVDLAVCVAPESLTFQVGDTGPGINANDHERIFQPFTRLNPDRQAGAGLGLSISRHLIEVMGGQLMLESEPGRGSRFSFSLPLNPMNQPEPALDLNGRSVLLVDDDPDILAIHELFLKDWGMQVHCASSLLQALSLVEKQSFDLVLTDLHLEKGSGSDLLKVIRSQQDECATILCSGSGVSTDWQERYAQIADEVLIKPVQPERMKAVISRALSARGH